MQIRNVVCENCRKVFDRDVNRHKRAEHHYCCMKCGHEHALKLNLEEAVGKRFGNLVVLRYCGKDVHGRNMCLTRCDCGAETVKALSLVRSGKSTRCDRYCVAENIAKKKIEKDIIDAKKEKRITNSVKVFIRENNDCSDEYIDEIMKVYRLDKQEVLDILVEKQKGLQNDN